MMLSELGTIYVSLSDDTSSSLIDLIESWSGRVLRLYRERNTSYEELPTAWGVHDLIGAMHLRSFVQDGLDEANVRRGASSTPSVLEVADELFCSFTTDRHEALIEHDTDLPANPWWWRRAPSTGPVAEDLATG